MAKIIKTKHFTLRPVKMSDASALARSINDKTIAHNTLHIPNPYSLRDAKDWINKCQRNNRRKQSQSFSLSIEIDGQIVGGIGFHNIARRHKAELGYWLARKYWGRGLMTKIVKTMVRYGFNALKLKRIYAFTFAYNKASARVLIKNGFKQEGFLRKNVIKKGKAIDEYIYSIIK